MKKNTELIFVRRMLENTLDQGDMEQALAMSRRIDELMQERIRRDLAREEATM